MRAYSFDYIEGKSRPRSTIEADNHVEFYKKLKEFLMTKCVGLCPDTIRYQESGIVPDPTDYNAYGLAPGEYNLAAAKRAGIQLPGMSILEG